MWNKPVTVTAKLAFMSFSFPPDICYVLDMFIPFLLVVLRSQQKIYKLNKISRSSSSKWYSIF